MFNMITNKYAFIILSLIISVQATPPVATGLQSEQFKQIGRVTFPNNTDDSSLKIKRLKWLWGEGLRGPGEGVGMFVGVKVFL